MNSTVFLLLHVLMLTVWGICRTQSPRNHQPDGAGLPQYLPVVGGPPEVLPHHQPLLHRDQGHVLWSEAEASPGEQRERGRYHAAQRSTPRIKP